MRKTASQVVEHLLEGIEARRALARRANITWLGENAIFVHGDTDPLGTHVLEFAAQTPPNRTMGRVQQYRAQAPVTSQGGGTAPPAQRQGFERGGGGLDPFTKGYVNTALATSTDESTPSGGYPLDRNYSVRDLDEAALTKMKADCAQFQQGSAELLDACGLDSERAGRDFWLSRNGHGSGFWDEHTMDDSDPQFQACKQLHKVAQGFGTYDLYLGEGEDEGVIYGYPA